MFCQKCGKEISDTVKFCAFCGTPVKSTQIHTMPVAPVGTFNSEGGSAIQEGKVGEGTEIDEDATVVLTNSSPKGTNSPKEGVGDNVKQRVPVIPVAPPPVSGAEISPGQKKKFPAGILLIGLMGVVAAVVVVLLIKGVFSGGNKEFSKVAYMKDEELCIIPNINASEPDSIEFIKIKNASDYSSSAGYLAQFSDDGSYLYYFSKFDSVNGTGTLCRIPAAKLTNDESKNEKLEEEIDKKVSVDSCQIIDNTNVVYKKSGNRLFFYVDGEAYELTDSLRNNDYYITEDKTHVVYCDEDKVLYIQKLVKDSESKEVDRDVDYVSDSSNSEFVVYCKDYDGENNVRDLYVGGIDKKPELIAEDISSYDIDGENQSLYYYVEKTEKNALVNYVDDPYADSDADVKEPEYIDYFLTERNYPELSEDDNGEYTQEEFMRMISYDYDYTFDMNYYYNYDNGKTYYYNQDNEKWYTDFDMERYEQAQQDYEASGRRQNLREELKTADPVSDFYYELYYYKDGKSSEICDRVASEAAGCKQGVIYVKKEAGEVRKTYDINEINSADDLRNRVESDYGTENDAEDREKDQEKYFYTIRGSKEAEVTDFDEIVSLQVVDNGRKAVITGDYDEEGMGQVTAYDVSGSGLGKGETISKEGGGIWENKNIFYYYENVDQNEGDLYSYDGSDVKLLAKDMQMYTGFVADDGTLTGCTDWDENAGDLTVFGKDGKGERVAKNVQSFRYLGSNTYLIMKDEDLYYLNKAGEEICLAKNVQYFWYPGTLPGFFIYYER